MNVVLLNSGAGVRIGIAVSVIALPLIILGSTITARTSEPPPTPVHPLVIAFNGGHWERIRGIEFKGPVVEYLNLGGNLVSAPAAMINVPLTQTVNDALEAFDIACEEGGMAEGIFDLKGPAGVIFTGVAKFHDHDCYRVQDELFKTKDTRKAQQKLNTTANNEPVISNSDSPGMVISNNNLLRAYQPTKKDESALESTSPPKSTPPGHQQDPSVRAFCANEWPDNFSMRAHCEKRQNEAIANLTARTPTSAGIPPEVLGKIRSFCGNEWPDTFTMRDHCEKRQIEAITNLTARTPTSAGIPPEVLGKIRSFCSNEWPDTFTMRDHCEKRQIEGYLEVSR